jgi:hypothetical protein
VFRRRLHRRASAVDAWRSPIVNAGIDVAAAGEGAFRADECNAIPLRARQHQIVASEAAEWADHVLERRQLCGHSAKSLGDISFTAIKMPCLSFETGLRPSSG